MSNLGIMLRNYHTTIGGFVLGVLYYLAQVGGTFPPKSGAEWLHFVVAALLAGVGFVAKDALTGSAPKIVVLILVPMALLSGCSSLAKTFLKYDTVTVPRIDVELTYADIKALIAVAKDRVTIACALGKLPADDCAKLKEVDGALLIVDGEVRQALRSPDVSANWDNITRLINTALPIFALAGTVAPAFGLPPITPPVAKP